MFLTVLLLFKGANFQAAMINQGSAMSHNWVNVYPDDLRDSNRLLVCTNVGKLVSWRRRWHLCFFPFLSSSRALIFRP